MKTQKMLLNFLIVFWVIVSNGCSFEPKSYSINPEMYDTRPGHSMALEVKVAAISLGTYGSGTKNDLQKNADKLESLFREAKKQGAQLAVAQEGAIDGYIGHSIFLWDYTNPPHVFYETAIYIDDPIIKQFRNLAEELDMCLVFGFAEKIDNDVYNTAIFIDNKGEIAGKYHKMQGGDLVRAPEHVLEKSKGKYPSKWYYHPGTENRAFDTPFGRCGMLICNDGWNPALARIAVLDGARYLLMCAKGGLAESYTAAAVARARENGVPVVKANYGICEIISEGEMVAMQKATSGDASSAEIMLVDTIAISPLPSRENRDAQERAFLEGRRQGINWSWRKYERHLGGGTPKDPHKVIILEE